MAKDNEIGSIIPEKPGDITPSTRVYEFDENSFAWKKKNLICLIDYFKVIPVEKFGEIQKDGAGNEFYEVPLSIFKKLFWASRAATEDTYKPLRYYPYLQTLYLRPLILTFENENVEEVQLIYYDVSKKERTEQDLKTHSTIDSFNLDGYEAGYLRLNNLYVYIKGDRPENFGFQPLDINDSTTTYDTNVYKYYKFKNNNNFGYRKYKGETSQTLHNRHPGSEISLLIPFDYMFRGGDTNQRKKLIENLDTVQLFSAEDNEDVTLRKKDPYWIRNCDIPISKIYKKAKDQADNCFDGYRINNRHMSLYSIPGEVEGASSYRETAWYPDNGGSNTSRDYWAAGSPRVFLGVGGDDDINAMITVKNNIVEVATENKTNYYPYDALSKIILFQAINTEVKATVHRAERTTFVDIKHNGSIRVDYYVELYGVDETEWADEIKTVLYDGGYRNPNDTTQKVEFSAQERINLSDNRFKYKFEFDAKYGSRDNLQEGHFSVWCLYERKWNPPYRAYLFKHLEDAEIGNGQSIFPKLTDVSDGGFGLYQNDNNEELCVYLGADAIGIDVFCNTVLKYAELDLKEYPQCDILTTSDGIKVFSRGKELVLDFQEFDEGDEIFNYITKEIVELKKTTFSFPEITKLPYSSYCGWMFQKTSPCNEVDEKWKPSDDLYNFLDPLGGTSVPVVGYIGDFPPISVSLTCWTLTSTPTADFAGRIWQTPDGFSNYNFVAFCDVDGIGLTAKEIYHPIAPEYINFFELGSQEVKEINVYEAVEDDKGRKVQLIEGCPKNFPKGRIAGFEQSTPTLTNGSKDKGRVSLSFGCRIGGNRNIFLVLGQRKGFKEN